MSVSKVSQCNVRQFIIDNSLSLPISSSDTIAISSQQTTTPPTNSREGGDAGRKIIFHFHIPNLKEGTVQRSDTDELMKEAGW